MAQIARENGINDNLLFNWRHQYRKGGLLPSGKNMPALLPVTLTPEPDNKIPAPAQEPEQIHRPTVCVVSWFCRPELSGLKET